MNTIRQFVATLLTCALIAATSPAASAQEAQQANLSAGEIDSIVSPIALYPDQLVAQILGAATYPDQVSAASNWINSNQGLQGDALMQAADKQPWDPSVKALTQFPTVLDQMAKNLAWTSALGDAAYNQQKDVMASIQRLRQQAKAAGNLKSSQQIQVVQQDPQTIVIQPANPQVVYVPTYSPTVVYGTPYNPPGYSTGAMVATGLLSFGVGIAVGAAINNNSCCGWGWNSWGCGWHGGSVTYNRNVYVSRSNTFYGSNRQHYRNNYYGGNRPTHYNGNNRYNGGNNRVNGGNNRNTNISGNNVNINTGNRNPNNNNRPNVGGNNNNRPNNGGNRNGNLSNQSPGNNNNRPGGNNNVVTGRIVPAATATIVPAATTIGKTWRTAATDKSRLGTITPARSADISRAGMPAPTGIAAARAWVAAAQAELNRQLRAAAVVVAVAAADADASP
jgi:hypothetical protein